MENYKLGIFGERIVVLYLLLKGYKILGRRYRCKFGEIDIIATHHRELVAFEVKSSKAHNLTTEIVSQHQRTRIRNALNYFIQRNPRFTTYNVVLDIILFDGHWGIRQIRSL